MLHPGPDRLEAYVEGVLHDSDRVVVESHLVSCGRCRAEAEEWRAVFAALAALPRIEASPGFADRVMAGVRVPNPWMARLGALIRRLVPTGTAGWVLVTAFLALPALVGGGVVAWLLSRPSITAAGLWIFILERTVDGVRSLAGRAGSALLESGAALWVWNSAKSVLAGVGTVELGAAAAAFAVVMLLSLWILYDNLFRTSTREKHYAMHVLC